MRPQPRGAVGVSGEMNSGALFSKSFIGWNSRLVSAGPSRTRIWVIGQAREHGSGVRMSGGNGPGAYGYFFQLLLDVKVRRTGEGWLTLGQGLGPGTGRAGSRRPW